MSSPASSEENLGNAAAGSSSQSRQRPGSACDECRRKKLRCDRGKPSCSACIDSGLVCQVSTVRSKRGPKRGHLAVLRSRIAALQRQINEQDEPSAGAAHAEAGEQGNLAAGDAGQQLLDQCNPVGDLLADLPSPPQDFVPAKAISNNAELQSPIFPRGPESLGASGATIPQLTRADLDQLFFDRVYMFTPILQQARYFSWAKQSWSSPSRTCLQYAVWTLAASFSSQFQPLKEQLYRDTRKMLQTFELEDGAREDGSHLDLAQTWILVATYEFMQTNFTRAWGSVGRALRFVQLMKLNQIDLLNCFMGDGFSTAEENWVETEEKTRTFWMAYCLDRFCCGLKGPPLTLNEDVISTRLPAQESDFQTGTSSLLMPSLSDVMTTPNPTILSPFTECIIFSTLWGRSLDYQQKFTASSTSTNFWDYYLSLDTIVTQRIQLLLTYNQPNDSMMLFTSMIAQATILSLCKVLGWNVDGFGVELGESPSQVKAVEAAREIAKLARGLRQLSVFKVHPFTPIPLYVCSEYFSAHHSLDPAFEIALQEIKEALAELRSVNIACQNHLELLSP